MQVCTECFKTLKESRVPIALAGSFNGVSFAGKKLRLEDSSNPRHESRGGWKVVCNTTTVGFASASAGSASILRDEGGLFFSSKGASNSVCEFDSRVAGSPKASAIFRIMASLVWKPLPLPKLFMGTDSNAGGSVTDEKSLLVHDPLIPVHFVVEGITSGEEALTTTENCGVATYLVQDRESREYLVIKHGGFYQFPENSITSTVSSSSQVGNFFNATKGLQGAQYHTADPDNAYMQLPEGHSVELVVNDAGAHGCWVQPLAPLDPRL